MRAALQWRIAAAAAGIAGCALAPVPDSGEISTRDLTVDVAASDAGGGASVRIRLSSPLGSVRITEGDALRLSMADQALPLREVEEDGQTVYRTEPIGLTADLVARSGSTPRSAAMGCWRRRS